MATSKRSDSPPIISNLQPGTLLEFKLKEAYKALDAIEWIVSDDFCHDLELKVFVTRDRSDLTKRDKMCNEKFSLIYMISHSESPNHSCHRVHDKWRKVKNKILAQKKKIINDEMRESPRKRSI